MENADRKTGGLPQAITVDNGPEFAGKTLDATDYANGMAIDFTRPGKPTVNGHIESSNGKLRDKLLNTENFFSFKEARKKREQHRLI